MKPIYYRARNLLSRSENFANSKNCNFFAFPQHQLSSAENTLFFFDISECVALLSRHKIGDKEDIQDIQENIHENNVQSAFPNINECNSLMSSVLLTSSYVVMSCLTSFLCLENNRF